jgi:ribonuclease E
MLINAVDPEEYRVAFIKDGLLDGFLIETSTAEQIVGNIYKGTIERVEPRLQACFVNYGLDKNGFLSINDIHPEYFQIDFSSSREGDHSLPHIEKVVQKGQEVLVQVTKEMPGPKGAQLTTYVSLTDIPRVDPWPNHYRRVSEDRRRGRETEAEIGYRAAQNTGRAWIHCQNRGGRSK